MNILVLAELLFSLPTSNGKLERVFSQLNVIKTEKRTLLSNESLDDLLPDSAIDIWWKEKVRQPNQRGRKNYKKHRSDVEDGSESEVNEDSDIEPIQFM